MFVFAISVEHPLPGSNPWQQDRLLPHLGGFATHHEAQLRCDALNAELVEQHSQHVREHIDLVRKGLASGPAQSFEEFSARMPLLRVQSV